MPSGPKKRKKAAAAAAKRKEEEEMGIYHPPPPLPPTNPLPPQQDKEFEEKVEMESTENAREESPSSELSVSEVKDVNIEFVKSKVEEEPSSVAERSSEILLQKVSGEASAAHLAEEKIESEATVESSEVKEEVGGSSLGGETSVTERYTEVILEKVSEEASAAHLTEEKMEASEATVVSSEVKDLGNKFAEAKEESEHVGEASVVPVSVPADSVLSEGEESREMLNMGTVIDILAVAPTSTEVSAAPGPAPVLEHRTSLWNCCGLFDVFKGSH